MATDLTRVNKKLAETEFFLRHLWNQERERPHERDVFVFFLSALLNAGRTVDYRLCHEQPSYPQWRKRWNQHHQREDKLMKFMHDERDKEIHRSGSVSRIEEEAIRLSFGSNDYSGGTLTIFGPPDMPGGEGSKPIYWINRDGTERKVTELCEEYLTATKSMVVDFEVDQP